MAPTLDPSTPAVATSATTSVTTSSFTPPVGAVLYAITLHATNGRPDTRASTLSSTPGLTWTSQVSSPLGPSPAPDGSLARLWTAVVSVSQAMTVTSTITANGFGGSVLCVLVYTGADTTTPVEGAVAGHSTGVVSQSITAATDGAIPWLGNIDWGGAGTPTAGSGVTTYHASAPNGADNMWIATRAPISPAGSATINSTAPTGATFNDWVAFAVRAATATAAAAVALPAVTTSAAATVTAGTTPSITGTPQATSVTAHATTVTYTGGGTTGSDTYDLLFINSDNVVTVPEFGTAIATRVNSQGSYIFAAQGGTTTATINLGGGINSPTSVLWVRVTDTDGPDTGATAVAGVDGTTGTTTPAITSGTLATSSNFVLAFAAHHSFGGFPPANMVWSSGYQQQIEGTAGTGSSGVHGALAVKVPAGTAAESPSASWSNGSAPADRYMLVTALLPASGAVTSTAAVALPAVTATAAGTAAATGTATAILPAVAASSTGTVATTGTAAITLAPLTASTAGTVSATGAGASILPAATAAATGSVSTTGAAATTLPAVTVSATGTASVTGTAAGLLPAILTTATGTASTSGTAAATLPAMQAAAIGDVAGATSGGITAVLPAFTATATGIAANSGSIAAALPAPGVTATGTVAGTGTINTVLPAVQAAAAGAANTVTASAALPLPAVQVAASGTATVTGLAAISLPALVAAATGVSPITGSAALLLPALVASGTDTPVYVRRPGRFTTGARRSRLTPGGHR